MEKETLDCYFPQCMFRSNLCKLKTILSHGKPQEGVLNVQIKSICRLPLEQSKYEFNDDSKAPLARFNDQKRSIPEV